MNKQFKYILLTTFTSMLLTSCGGSLDTNDGDVKAYDLNKNATVYETAEDGSTKRWTVWGGHPIENAKRGANGSNRSIFLKKDWDLADEAHPINNANYVLSMVNDQQFILEFDKMKINGAAKHCFTTGVTVETTDGTRHLSFNTFYDREGFQTSVQNLEDGSTEIIFPLNMSYVNDSDVWKHIRLDLNAYLHQQEPNNNITSTTQFYFQGGDDYLDNIRLVSK
jgi:hypothetical protein